MPVRSTAMLNALSARGPHPDLREKLALFGQFVGHWEIVGRFYAENGSVEDEHSAEWRFGWVLEGRAIQDVLIRRSGTNPADDSSECGTTIRVYDPTIDAWRVIWVPTHHSRVVSLIARAKDSDIWLEGRAPEGALYRWIFSDIEADAFLWRGYQSADEGLTWFFGQEMEARRASGSPTRAQANRAF